MIYFRIFSNSFRDTQIAQIFLDELGETKDLLIGSIRLESDEVYHELKSIMKERGGEDERE